MDRNDLSDLFAEYGVDGPEEEKRRRVWLFLLPVVLLLGVAYFLVGSEEPGTATEFGSTDNQSAPVQEELGYTISGDVGRPTEPGMPEPLLATEGEGATTTTLSPTSTSEAVGDLTDDTAEVLDASETTVVPSTTTMAPPPVTTTMAPPPVTTTSPPSPSTTSTTSTTTTTTTTLPPTTTTAPPSAPPAPSAFSIAPSEQADSTPTVRFTWGSMSSASELEYNYYDGFTWSGWETVSKSSRNSGYLPAEFNTDQRYQLRARNCSAGLCSNWTYSNEAVEQVGGPAPEASAPSEPGIGGDATYNATYAYSFSWTNVFADEMECATNSSYNNWSDCTVFSRSGNSSANGSVYQRVRVRNSNAANVYGGGGYSDWIYSQKRTYSFGAPAANASTPSRPTINTAGTKFDSSYYYQFNWDSVGASQQQCSYNGGGWTNCVGTSWSGNAGSGQTKSLAVRVRNTATPNNYGGGEDSDWVTATEKSVTFGSPASTPSRPSAFTVSGSTGDLFANFSWSVSHNGQQECSTNNGSSWSPCSSYSVPSPGYSTSYTLKVRVSNYTSPNDYGGGGYSSWRESNNASVTTPAPPGPTVTGWSRWTTNENTELGTIPRYHISVSFTGTVDIKFFYNSNCSGSSSSLRTNRATSDGASSTSQSGWVYNVYNGGSALLTDTSTGSSACSNTSW